MATYLRISIGEFAAIRFDAEPLLQEDSAFRIEKNKMTSLIIKGQRCILETDREIAEEGTVRFLAHHNGYLTVGCEFTNQLKERG